MLARALNRVAGTFPLAALLAMRVRAQPAIDSFLGRSRARRRGAAKRLFSMPD